MSQISFCTSLKYSENEQSFCNDIRESVDSYFYLGGKKLKVIKIDEETNVHHVAFVKAKPAYLTTALKVLSYFTVVLPILMFVLKAILRSCVNFKIVDNTLGTPLFNPTLPLVPQELPLQRRDTILTNPTVPQELPLKPVQVRKEAILVEQDDFADRLKAIKNSDISYANRDAYFIELANEELLKNKLENAFKATKEIWSNTKAKDQLFESIANAYFLKQDYQEAYKTIKDIWSDTKTKDAFLAKLAETYLSLNDCKEAYKVIKDVWNDRKTKDTFFVKLAEKHLSLNDYEEAYKVIKDVWDDRKAKDTFLVKLVEIHYGIGDYETSFKVAKDIDDKTKKDGSLIKIAQGYIAQNLIDEAKKVTEEISKENPLRQNILVQILTPDQLRLHNELESISLQFVKLVVQKEYDNALALIRRYPYHEEKLSYYKNLVETKKCKEELSKLIERGNVNEAITVLKNQNKDSKRDSLLVKIIKKLSKKSYMHEAASLMQRDSFESKDKYRAALVAFAKARNISILEFTDRKKELKRKIIKHLEDKNLHAVALKI